MKKKPLFFKKIAVVVGFSPNTKKLILEAKRLCKIYNAKLYTLHIGKEDLETETYFKNLFHSLGIKKEEIHFEIKESINVESSIVKKCRDNDIDLLVMGALKEENFIKKYITGSISRNIIKKIKCSVLLLTEPLEDRKKFNEIIVVAEKDNPKTKNLIETSHYVAENENIESINIFRNIPKDDLEMAVQSLEMSEIEKTNFRNNKIAKEKTELEKEISDINFSKNYNLHISLENRFLDLKRFTDDINSNLIMINSNEKKKFFIDTIFPKDIENLLENLPCNLMIIHTRLS